MDFPDAQDLTELQDQWVALELLERLDLQDRLEQLVPPDRLDLVD